MTTLIRVKLYQIIFFIVLFILNTACTHKKSVKKIEILKNHADLFSISVRGVISLDDCSDSCLIGTIDKLTYFRKRFYILDVYHARTFFIYNNEGKLISKSKLGKGPGELIRPRTFYIDTLSNDTGSIFLFDDTKGIISFDLKGRYLGTQVNHGLEAYDIVRFDENSLLVYTTYPSMSDRKSGKSQEEMSWYIYALVDNSFKKDIRNFFPIYGRDDRLAISLYTGMAFYKNEIKCLVPLDNNIYSFNGKTMNAEYYIDFGKLAITKSDIKQGLDFIDPAIKNKIRAGRCYRLMETDQFMIFSYYFGQDKLFGIYSKKDKKAAVFNDILKRNNLPYNTAPIACIGNKIICAIDVDELSNQDINKNSIFNNCVLYNNPVLMFMNISTKQNTNQ